MLEREVKEFVRAALGVHRETGMSLDEAKRYTSLMLGVPVPAEADFNKALIEPPAKKSRGRARREGLSRRDAVAAVAVYFGSIGAGVEQATNEAKRWLNITLSRRVAKVAVAAFKANTAPSQYRIQALWAYETFKPGSTLPLPTIFVKTRKKRQAKTDLG